MRSRSLWCHALLSCLFSAGFAYPQVVVTVSPTTASVQPSATQPFTPSVTAPGSADKAVTWSVNGIAGGNATVGTITADGHYTAPSVVPNPSSVSVMATSHADPSKSAAATVTIAALTAAKVVKVEVQNASGPVTPEQERLPFSLGDTLIVAVDNAAPLKKATATNPLGLFLNGLFINGIDALAVPNDPNDFQFQLEYTAANRDAWSQLFGCKTRNLGADCKVVAAVGLKDGSAVAEGSTQPLDLMLLPGIWAKFILVIPFLLAVATVILGRRSSMLRDTGAPRTDKKLGTYSLARCQMALWFVTIVFAFLYIYAVTGVVTAITTGALILMGIAAATALGAAAIDQNNQTASSTSLVQLSAERLSLQNQTQALDQQIKAAPQGDPNLAALQAQQQTVAQRLKAVNDQLAQTGPPQVAASEGLIKDILTDINGICFHRLQIVAWTVVLWVLFMSSLFGKLTMMDFDTTQLVLMGISGGTYLGFKLNEKQS